MSEIRDRPAGEEETGVVRPGARRRIYAVEPSDAMVERFQRATSENLGHEEARAGLRAAINPAAEDAGCGAGLLAWHRDPDTRQPVADGHQRCPLEGGHHGSHITPDGLHVWDDDEDEDEEP